MVNTFYGDGDKNILIISGVHGDEHTPVAITEKIITKINDFSKNYKTLNVIHRLNKPALNANKRFVDGIDLNRAFDGNTKHQLVNFLMSEIENADVIIDIHSSYSCMELIAIDQNEYAKSFCDFADNLDIPYMIHKGNEGTIKRYCISINKPCFTFEVNRLEEIDSESVEKGYNMINNMIDHISELEFKPSKEVPKLTKMIFTKPDCIILPLVNKGDTIKPNQKIAIKINKTGESSYIISQEDSEHMVLTTKYIDYTTDPMILYCNKQKNISLFSIF